MNGCSKKELNIPLIEDTKNQQEVIKQFLKIPENASDELRYLIGDIKKTEGQYHFLYEFIQRNGMPDWVSSESNLPILNGSSTKAGSITSNSVVISSNSLTSGGTYFIPLIDTNSKEVKSYIFCSKLSDGKIKYKTYNKQAILSSTAKDSNDVKLKGVMLSVFAHFERKINKKNSLTFPFPYNFNLKNVELSFLSDQIGSILNNATPESNFNIIKNSEDAGCGGTIRIGGSAGNFLVPFGAVLVLHYDCAGNIFSWFVDWGPTGGGGGSQNPNPIPPPNPTPPVNPSLPNPPVFNPPSYTPSIPYFPYTPPNLIQPGTGIGGYTPTPIYGGPNTNYPPNWIEDPNNPFVPIGSVLDLIGMPGSNPTNNWSPIYVPGEVDPDYYLNSIDVYHKSKIEEYYNSIDHYWENSSYENIFPPYDPSIDGQRDADGYRKNGPIYHYQGGDVQNYTDDNGGKYAIFTKLNGETIKFPGATITDNGVLSGAGLTTPNGGIRMSTNQNGLVDLQHEYGHFLHANIIGSKAYFNKVVPSSLYSAFLATLTGSSHQSNWTEKIANNLSATYFGPNSPIAISTFYQK